jgi:hypothetical protein
MSGLAPASVSVPYHQEPQRWWAESPDIEGWSVSGQSYEQVHQLANNGVTFALMRAAEGRGGVF